ncbi:MAG: GNAT family N-acetyltransferase [Chloroflexota bacterium]
MEIKFVAVDLPDITDRLIDHLSALPSPVDSFFEDHVEDSNQYWIHIDGVNAGHVSIHGGNLVTQFCLHDAFKRYGQLVFQHVKKMESVRQAFVPTCDEFFLSHALDEQRSFACQAYFFQHTNGSDSSFDTADLTFRQAQADDIDLIRQVSGDFVEPVEEHVQNGELFITSKGDECAGLGVMIHNKFCLGYAAIGMFTVESFRNTGVGTATIRFLIQECKRQQTKPTAGCWYYNHFSKKTLEKAGMYSQARLLKIGF